jgi:hypothetical protein
MIVIASEAKQSIAPQGRHGLASLLAMTIFYLLSRKNSRSNVADTVSPTPG